MVWLYALILLAVALGLWGAYRVLGTPSRLAQRDYDVVLVDIRTSVERAADRLRRALETGPGRTLEDEASAARKIFQTGYYQTLRLRPASGPDLATAARAELGRACEAYDWASRILGSESVRNPLVLDAARRLLDSGDAALKQAALELPPLDVSRGSSGP
jgi:cytochrome c-type biogenesis protein CcmH/NrfG